METTAITIRKLDQKLKIQLRLRAAEHGRSMEEEAREILKEVLNRPVHAPIDLATSIRRRFAPIGGVELPLPKREAIRPAPDFDK